MYRGFPASLVNLIRCPHDGGALEQNARPGSDERWVDADLRCSGGGHAYAVIDGILRLLDPTALDAESAHERRLRDENAVQEHRLSLSHSDDNAMEMRATLAALAPHDKVLLELGCGTGRYTVPLAYECRAVVAADFSLDSLRILATSLSADANIGLVHGDVTKLRVAPAFAVCLSTLVSNLPSADHRDAMYRVAAQALADGGRFVFGTHFYNLRDRWSSIPQAGRYTGGGIYRYRFREEEIRAEARRHFAKVGIRPIKIRLPMTERLGLPLPMLSALCEHVPVLNQLGELLLVRAEGPVVLSDGISDLDS